jgi:hypothetical protein
MHATVVNLQNLWIMDGPLCGASAVPVLRLIILDPGPLTAMPAITFAISSLLTVIILIDDSGKPAFPILLREVHDG